MKLVVLSAADACQGVRTLRLGRPDGGLLPAYAPGSHLVVHAGERRNAYSLTGIDTDFYEISVRLTSEGAGGSAWMWALAPGAEVEVSGPRCLFAPVATAKQHLLVAGGIGITPLLSHARAAVRWQRPFRLMYGYRPGQGAYLPELRELCGANLAEYTSREVFWQAIHKNLYEQPLGTHLYVCGPDGLLSAITEEAVRAGWPDERVHFERFTPAELDPGRPFTLRLSTSRRDVAVPSGVSMLEALENSGIRIPSMCRQGVCGECRLRVLSGEPEHRDLFLAEDEQAEAVMPCVSRARSDLLEVEL